MEPITTFKAGTKYGLILGAASVILGLVAYFTGLQDFTSIDSNWILTLLTYALVIGITYLGIMYFKDNNDNELSLGESVSTGLFTGLISGLILMVWTYIFFNFIDPDALTRMLDLTLSSPEYEEMPDETLEQVESWMGFMFNPGMMGLMTLIGRIILTLIVGLVVGLVKKTQ